MTREEHRLREEHSAKVAILLRAGVSPYTRTPQFTALEYYLNKRRQ